MKKLVTAYQQGESWRALPLFRLAPAIIRPTGEFRLLIRNTIRSFARVCLQAQLDFREARTCHHPVTVKLAAVCLRCPHLKGCLAAAGS